MDDYSYIKRNWEATLDEIGSVAARVGVPAPTLLPVTKSGSDEELLSLLSLGIGDFAENRPQELIRRADLLAANGMFPRLHEIGSLQKNKVRLLVGRVALIHSVDSVALAEEIERVANNRGATVRVLLEINSGKEEAKGGVFPEEARRVAEAIAALPHLSLSGVMTMGPASEDPEDLRPYFRATRKTFEDLSDLYAEGTPILSMGMSDSFAVAIEEGSTLLRIGRRLFRK